MANTNAWTTCSTAATPGRSNPPSHAGIKGEGLPDGQPLALLQAPAIHALAQALGTFLVVAHGPLGIGGHEILAIECRKPLLALVWHIHGYPQVVMHREGRVGAGADDGGEAIRGVGFAPGFALVRQAEVAIEVALLVFVEIVDVDMHSLVVELVLAYPARGADVVLPQVAEAVPLQCLLQCLRALLGKNTRIEVEVEGDKTLLAVGSQQRPEGEEELPAALVRMAQASTSAFCGKRSSNGAAPWHCGQASLSKGNWSRETNW